MGQQPKIHKPKPEKDEPEEGSLVDRHGFDAVMKGFLSVSPKPDKSKKKKRKAQKQKKGASNE